MPTEIPSFKLVTQLMLLYGKYYGMYIWYIIKISIQNTWHCIHHGHMVFVPGVKAGASITSSRIRMYIAASVLNENTKTYIDTYKDAWFHHTSNSCKCTESALSYIQWPTCTTGSHDTAGVRVRRIAIENVWWVLTVRH